MISSFLKIQTGLSLLVPGYPDGPLKEVIKCLSVCLSICLSVCCYHQNVLIWVKCCEWVYVVYDTLQRWVDSVVDNASFSYSYSNVFIFHLRVVSRGANSSYVEAAVNWSSGRAVKWQEGHLACKKPVPLILKSSFLVQQQEVNQDWLS